MMKLIRLVKLTLGGLLCLFSVSSFAATGWCTTVAGTKIYNFPFVKQYDNPADNKAGMYFNRTYEWNLAANYAANCDCTASANTFYKAVVPGNLTATRDFDGLHFYSINQYLEVATELYVGGYRKKWIPTPFSNEDNEFPSACSGVTNWISGANGYVSLYFTRPFVGQVVIPNTKILDLYGSKVSGSYGGVPMSSVYMSGSVTVPQSCEINAGQVINVNFDNIMSNDIKTKGDIANGFTPKVVNMTLACNNISNGVVVSLSFSGEPASGDPTALKSYDNTDIGVRVRDANNNIVSPINGNLPVTFDYSSQTGTSSMTLAPMNVTGNTPALGRFNAVATINAEIN
ncbi:fimbrial protein [Serratia fonticola]|jgi:type 1 fimbria pilin|uniref:fimbrial protein n=1 Tax=Serratia fonticola TaxID=47917 RepID=UPI0021C8B516|nr:fimbrial protein [Serratia fonticola]